MIFEAPELLHGRRVHLEAVASRRKSISWIWGYMSEK
jgi:hypothetical protein